MSWLSRVRNGIQSLTKRQSADNLWHKCAKCTTMVFTKEWEDNASVCPRCDHHDRIGPVARFDALFDRQKYDVLPSPEVREDPLKFRDTKRYSDRIKAARAKTGTRDALIHATGTIERKKPLVVATVAAGFSLLSYYFIGTLLRVPLPLGPFGW